MKIDDIDKKILQLLIENGRMSYAEIGKLTLEEVLQSATDYAEHGYPVSPTLGKYWASAFQRYQELFNGDRFKSWFDTFAPNGRAPKIGEIWKSPGQCIKQNG
ncbi:gamma-glutamyltranspeptidase [Tepidibacillus sp. HK-1]|nr:gamma-glutamyltranspeptidase [Tepidibacillus sp. HK-1]